MDEIETYIFDYSSTSTWFLHRSWCRTRGRQHRNHSRRRWRWEKGRGEGLSTLCILVAFLLWVRLFLNRGVLGVLSQVEMAGKSMYWCPYSAKTTGKRNWCIGLLAYMPVSWWKTRRQNMDHQEWKESFGNLSWKIEDECRPVNAVRLWKRYPVVIINNHDYWPRPSARTARAPMSSLTRVSTTDGRSSFFQFNVQNRKTMTMMPVVQNYPCTSLNSSKSLVLPRSFSNVIELWKRHNFNLLCWTRSFLLI